MNGPTYGSLDSVGDGTGARKWVLLQHQKHFYLYTVNPLPCPLFRGHLQVSACGGFYCSPSKFTCTHQQITVPQPSSQSLFSNQVSCSLTHTQATSPAHRQLLGPFDLLRHFPFLCYRHLHLVLHLHIVPSKEQTDYLQSFLYKNRGKLSGQLYPSGSRAD